MLARANAVSRMDFFMLGLLVGLVTRQPENAGASYGIRSQHALWLVANHCAGKAKRLCFANPFFGLPYAIGLQGSLKRGRGSLSYGIRSPRLGRVGIQLLLQILRQKAVDARQKYEPMPFIGECF